MIVIVDYGRGNLFGLGHALRTIGAENEISSDPMRVRSARHIILPGVGAFGAAKADLDHHGLTAVLREAAKAGTPILGICLGMQLLMEESEEFGRHKGLALISGHVKPLPAGDLRIPNVGWRALNATGHDATSAAFDGMMAYFNHSFGVEVSDPNDVTLTISVNGKAFAAGVKVDNVTGFQFHPEKSGPRGLELLGRALL